MTLVAVPTGWCTVRRSGRMRPKPRYVSSEDAAMGLLEEKQRVLRQGGRPEDCPIAWYQCDVPSCQGGYHLTSHPRPLDAGG